MGSLKTTKFWILLIALVAFALGAILQSPTARAASDQGWNGVTAKTAAYTCLASESGTIFTNRGATGSVTFTLPSVGLGLHYRFYGVADQTIVVSAGAGLAVTFNNAAAASLAAQTGSQKIGAQIEAWSDGTSWFLVGSTLGVTYTVAEVIDLAPTEILALGSKAGDFALAA